MLKANQRLQCLPAKRDRWAFDALDGFSMLHKFDAESVDEPISGFADSASFL